VKVVRIVGPVLLFSGASLTARRSDARLVRLLLAGTHCKPGSAPPRHYLDTEVRHGDQPELPSGVDCTARFGTL